MVPIRIKLRALLDARAGLDAIAAARLPVRASYPLAKIVRAAANEFRDFQTARDAIVRELGEPDRRADGEILGWRVPAAALQDFQRRIEELADVDVTLSADPVSVHALGDGTQLSAADLAACAAFFVEDETPQST